MTGPANWRVLWHNDGTDDEGPRVSAAAIAILDGADPQVVVTEEWHSRLVSILKCDNTDVYRLADGERTSWWSMFKYPFETPRLDTALVDGQTIVVSGTGRGVHVRRRDGADSEELGDLDQRTEDLVTGIFDGRPVAVLAWDPYDDGPPLVQAFELTTSPPAPPVNPPWRLPVEGEPWDWTWPYQWRLGRRGGRPVAGYADGALLDLRCAVTGDLDLLIYLDVLSECDCDCQLAANRCPRLLAVDDRAGLDLALVARHDGAVGCFDLRTEQLREPLLTGHEGELLGAKLGRLHGRPVAALLLDHGFSLYDLDQRDYLSHVELGARALDLAFGPDGRLALATDRGPMAGQLTL